MVLVFSGFANLFVSMGFGPALIQKKEIENAHLQTVFSVNIISGVLLALGLSLLSPLIALFYSEPILKPLTILISINFIILSMRSVQVALLVRNIEFKKYSIIDVLANLFSGILSIFLALLGFGVWSLAFRTILASLLFVFLLWKDSRWKPSFRIDLSKFKEMRKFSANLVGSNILNYWSKNIDNLLVGKYLGTFALGIYSRAFFLMLLPVSQLSEVINSVLFPVFSKISEDKMKTKDTFLKIVGLISYVSFPLMIVLLVMAKPFILFFYGPKWVEVIPTLRIFCLAGMLLSITIPFRSIFMSQGRTDMLFKWNLFESACIITAIFIGLRNGIIGVAIAITLTNFFVLWYPSWMIPGKLINVSFIEILKKIRFHFLFALLSGGGIVILIKLIQSFTSSNILILFCGFAVGFVIYFGLGYFSKIEAIKDISWIVKTMLTR